MRFRMNVGYLADLCSRVGVLCALGLAGLVAVAAPASAQTCTFGITDLSFGGIDLTANTVSDTTATLTANCQGQSGKVVRVCPSFGAGSGGSNAATGDPRYMLNGASKLGYNMFADTARTQIWASFRTGQVWGTPTIDIHLTTGGIGSVTQTVYGRIYANQQSLPIGTYLSSFAGADTWIAYGYSTAGTCPAISAGGAGSSSPFNVTATNAGACSVSATALDFGTVGVLQGATDGASTLAVTCALSTPYTIGLNGGNALASDPTQRKMANGAEQVVYGLYRDTARAQPWGNTAGVNTAAGSGSGTAQTFSVYGRMPAQSTPSPGTYTDTIVVTVTY